MRMYMDNDMDMFVCVHSRARQHSHSLRHWATLFDASWRVHWRALSAYRASLPFVLRSAIVSSATS